MSRSKHQHSKNYILRGGSKNFKKAAHRSSRAIHSQMIRELKKVENPVKEEQLICNASSEARKAIDPWDYD